MKLNLIQTKEILDFEKEIKHELVVTERNIHAGSPARLYRYFALFEDADILEGGFLIGKYGNGNTIDEAIKDYCRVVSNCSVVFGACTPKRIVIKFPKLVHSKLLNYNN